MLIYLVNEGYTFDYYPVLLFLQIFAVQFYGECWSGETSKVDYDRWSAADKSHCQFGVGGPNVNAVYRILP